MKNYQKNVSNAFRMLLAIVCLAVMFPVLASAQAKTFKGTVVDENGDPVIGATIMVKGTSIGTVTDFDGNYSITAEEGATLLFSFLGYSNQELPAANNMKVVLEEDTLDLDDVVVVGYGVQKKSSVTGAVSQVKSEDIQARTITNASQALQGKTAGVQVLSSSAKPGASPSVRIRGVSSNGDSSPLYVVDGRIAGDIGGIDPNDIESMEVLKDGASAAIYGASAGNGVILITTKKGKGEGKITYDFQYTSQSISRVPEVMNAEEFMNYYIEGGMISKETFYNDWDFKTNTNWVDVAFEKSSMKHHNVTFQAGSEKGSLYMSLSYLDNNGIIVGNSDTYRRLTGMINASWNIKSWLDISTNNQIEHYKSQSVAEGSEYGSMLLTVLQLDPLTKVTYTEEDMPQNMRDILNNPDYGELLSDGKGNYYGVSPFVTLENVNPLIMRDNSFTKSRGFNINGSTSLNLKPIKDLVITSRLGYRLSGSESYGVGQDYYANDTAHQNYVSLNASSYVPTYYQWENFANWTHTFGEAHNVGAMIGSSFSESRSFGVSGGKNGSDKGVDETTGEVTERDLGVKKDNPLFWYFAYATPTATKTVSGGEPSYTKKLAYFGRLSYDYMGRYMAQFSLRADAADSGVLPIDNRWGYFPAASLGWTMSEESFMADTRDWLDQLKLRASWGQNGSIASLGGYSYANVIASTGNYPTSQSGSFGYIDCYAPSSTGNNQLKWETSEQINVGLDARFLAGRLSLTMDYFNKKTKDLIVTGITPSTVVGNTASPINAGDIENKGLEVEVGWQDKVGDFHYGVRANIATLKNEVTYIHPSLKDGIDGASFCNKPITRFEVGNPAWYFYGYKFKGVNPETGNPEFVDVNGNGQLDEGDRTNIGKGMADMTYGLTLTAGWKGVDFILFGTGSAGNDVFCCLNRTDRKVNMLKEFVDDRWTPTHTNGSRPRANSNNAQEYLDSDACVFSGNYFKIKQIQLGYTLPQNIVKKALMENVRVYASLEDFFTFSKYPGFDPEVTGVGNSLGVDKGSYPNSKKVVFGFNVTF